MHERPHGVPDRRVLDLVREQWAPAATSAEHLPVGFGAWHWRISTPHGAVLFATLDPPLWHTGDTLESAYAGAATLARSLDFVHGPLVGADGTHCAPLGEGWLSVTPWVDGSRPEEFTVEAADLVRRLHAAEPPAGIPVWQPLVPAGLVDDLRTWTAEPWHGGPFGEEARRAVRERLSRLDVALGRYRALAQGLDPSTYVATHGEPQVHNQWRATDGRLLLIDWETLRLAPAERDLADPVGDHVPGAPDLLELFRLEWALSEVHSFSDWLREPHADDADTRVAIRTLHAELDSATRGIHPG